MIKKLKIRFVKFEQALAMQILEQKGAFNDSQHVKIKTFPFIDSEYVCLRGCAKEANLGIAVERFNSNDERDEYFEKITKWILEEQFTAKDEVKVGEICDVSNVEGRREDELEILAILPEQYPYRYITKHADYDTFYSGWKYAQPITHRTQIAIDGDIYTWTMEAKDGC